MSIIGVSQRIAVVPEIHEKRDCLAHDWGRFLSAAGIAWLPLPNRPHEIIDLVDRVKINGILLTGGDDIGVFPERDETENNLLEWAIRKNFPIIGVCRGLQVIQRYFGGELVELSSGDHVAKRHLVKTKTHGKREVNSFHRLGIADAAPGLEVVATSVVDGSVEAVTADNINGIMWHPERENEPDPMDIDLFRYKFKFGSINS
jgi:putative glutamine amidotransferase